MPLPRLLVLPMLLTFAGPAAAESFKFIALGDVPYYPRNASEKKIGDIDGEYDELITAINARVPAFTVHVGDTKSGKTKCSEEQLGNELARMGTFASPLIYTPGDNEWTDCQPDDGSGDNKANKDGGPRGWLRRIRELYFADNHSLGGDKIGLVRQGATKDDPKTSYVENARFRLDDVVVATVHVVGSNNGFVADDFDAVEEFMRRDRADRTWLNATFAEAEATKAKAVIIALHGDIFRLGYDEKKKKDKAEFPRHSGHKNIGEEIVARAKQFGKPVLLVYGDSHTYTVCRPFQKVAPNLQAVQVFGEDDINAVEITVDRDAKDAFTAEPVLADARKPENECGP